MAELIDNKVNLTVVENILNKLLKKAQKLLMRHEQAVIRMGGE